MKDLLPRIATGDNHAMEECLDLYGNLVWSLARRMSSSADADDAVQEIFLDIWKNAARFNRNVASEKTFVMMIARRRLIDRRRKLGREPQLQLLDEVALNSSKQDDADKLELGDEFVRATRCLEALQKEQRQAVELAVYHGLTHQQISARDDVPLGTVKAWIRRGMIQLRDCMNLRTISKGDF